MATITLTTDTLISSLMPSGGGSLASGDTIQLAGHSLIVDADAVNYPVTIANSGADANLELRDLGRVKLNTTLPANVHPYVDPAHPLPVSAAPGIDGDEYRTNLTANARAEIQLNGNFGLGGGAASLPTATRAGAFWAKVSSSADSTHLTFDRDFPLHKGDYLVHLTIYNQIELKTVVSYDPLTRTATIDSSTTLREVGYVWAVIAGGLCVNCIYKNSFVPVFTSDVSAGTLTVLSSFASYARCHVFFGCSVSAKRVLARYSASLVDGVGALFSFAFASVDEVACSKIIPRGYADNKGYGDISSCVLHIGEVACSSFGYNVDHIGGTFGSIFVGGGYMNPNYNTATPFSLHLKLSNMEDDNLLFFATNQSSLYGPPKDAVFVKTTAGSVHNVVMGGTVTLQSGTWYHAPATSSDATWRYADCPVPPGATLRLRCAWRREGSRATRASVAVTDTATWWPQLWPLCAEALASVEFTGGTAEWRSELLTWRNTGTEAATVRVWECVTGDTAGGYLKVEEVKGGQL